MYASPLPSGRRSRTSRPPRWRTRTKRCNRHSPARDRRRCPARCRGPPRSTGASSGGRPATSRRPRAPRAGVPEVGRRRATTTGPPSPRGAVAPRRDGRASARTATWRTRARSPPAGPAGRPRGRGSCGCHRGRARAGRARAAGRHPTSSVAARSASAMNQSRCLARIVSRSPRASSCSPAYSRIDFEEREARLAVGTLVDPDEALVGERHEAVDHVDAQLGGRAGDRLSRLDVCPPGEHRRPVEEPPAAVIEQVVAPGDGAAQGLLPLGQVPSARGEDLELVLEPAEDRIRGEELDPRGRELDGQRHAVQTGRDRRDRGCVLVRDGEGRADGDGPLDEQADRGVLADRGRVERALAARKLHALASGQAGRIRRRRQSRHRVLLLARDVEGGPAGRDHLQSRGGTEQARDHRSSVDDLLEVVEDQQDAPAREPLVEGLGDRLAPGVRDPDGRRDPRRDEHLVADRLQRHEEDPIGKIVRHGRRQLERETRLARSRRVRSSSAAGSSRTGGGPRRARRRGRRTWSAGSAGCSAGCQASAASGIRPAARRPPPGRGVPGRAGRAAGTPRAREGRRRPAARSPRGRGSRPRPRSARHDWRPRSAPPG